MPGRNQKAVVRLWRQTAQERPFTTKLFREADCAIYIADLTNDEESTKQKVVSLCEMLTRECRENIVKVLVGNKLDLQKKRQFQTCSGHEIVNECGMDQYVETSALHNIDVTSAINDIIQQIQRCDLPTKLVDDNISIFTILETEYPDVVSVNDNNFSFVSTDDSGTSFGLR